MNHHRQAEKATGGRGKKGGLSEYAERLGRPKQNIATYRDAAEVATNCHNDMTVLLDKSAHLSAVHKLPQAQEEIGKVVGLEKVQASKEVCSLSEELLKTNKVTFSDDFQSKGTMPLPAYPNVTTANVGALRGYYFTFNNCRDRPA